MDANTIEGLVDKVSRFRRPCGFPQTLTRKGMYILPTRQGLVFILVLFVMLIGAINYNNNLAFLFTFLLASMIFISLLHTHRTLSGLILCSASVAPVSVGDTGVFTLLLRSEARERMGIHLNFHGESDVETSLDGTRDQKVGIPFIPEKRGLFAIKPLTVSSSYPFGLFRTWATVYTDVTCLVYPKALAGPFNPMDHITDSDTEGRNVTRGTDDFKELRPYRPGDSISRLSWKSLARGKGLYTKEFERQAGASVCLSWDAVVMSDSERRISRLTDMVYNAHALNLSYGLSIPGTTIPPGEARDPAHFHLCLRTLALFNPGKAS